MGINYNPANTGQIVDDYINTAYDDIKKVNSNLDEIVRVANLSTSHQASDEVPTTRKDGSELQGSDTFFNTELRIFYMWDSETSSWVSPLEYMLYTPPWAGATVSTAAEMLNSGVVDVKWFSAVGNWDGTSGTDDTAVFQHCLNLLKGDNVTGYNREISAIYISPPQEGKSYGVSKLVIDGTHGCRIYADSPYTTRQNPPSGAETGHLLAYIGTNYNEPVLQIKGQVEDVSNPNFHIILDNIGIRGTSDFTQTATTSCALACVYIGALSGDDQSTINRQVIVNNCKFTNSRFGVYSGNPDGNNTDHATLVYNDCYIDYVYQMGYRNGTGNAITALDNCHITNTGYGSALWAADAYAPQIGCNVYIDNGYVYINNQVTGSGDTTNPTHADVYQASGGVAINGYWSDCLGYVFYQGNTTNYVDAPALANSGGSGRMSGVLNNIRHYEGSIMNEVNTPDSMHIVSAGTTVTSSLVYGNIEMEEGIGGSPVFSGVQFVRADASYVGTGVTNSKGVISIGNRGNDAQILMGGRDTNVDMTITSISKADPCEITVSSSLTAITGTEAIITGVVGMTEINNKVSPITITSSTTFTCDSIDSSSYSDYTSGGNAALRVSFDSLGGLPPQIVHSGGGETGSGATKGTRQFKGSNITDTVTTEYFANAADGSLGYLMNCIFVTSGNYKAIKDSVLCAQILLSPAQGFQYKVYDPDNGLTFTDSDWVDGGRYLTGGLAGVRDEVAYRLPILNQNPTFNSGDHWEAGLIYDQIDNKFRGNIGTNKWQDLNNSENVTFTPVVSSSTTNPSVVYTVQKGRATKLHNRWFFDIEIRTSSISSGSGSIQIEGLPELSSSSALYGQCLFRECTALPVLSAGEIYKFYIAPNEDIINIRKEDIASGADSTVSSWNSSGRLFLTGSYEVDL